MSMLSIDRSGKIDEDTCKMPTLNRSLVSGQLVEVRGIFSDLRVAYYRIVKIVELLRSSSTRSVSASLNRLSQSL